jgi:hypothetical protein
MKKVDPGEKRIGRNDPCPCGSGLKYKKCCLERDAEAARTERASWNATSSSPFLAGDFDDDCEDDPDKDTCWGYLHDHGSDPFHEEEPPVCMVFHPPDDQLQEINEHHKTNFSPGSWLISSGAHEATIIHGPFTSLEDAMRFGSDQLGATHWTFAPQSFGAFRR